MWASPPRAKRERACRNGGVNSCHRGGVKKGFALKVELNAAVRIWLLVWGMCGQAVETASAMVMGTGIEAAAAT
jgi:hypothetical protein